MNEKEVKIKMKETLVKNHNWQCFVSKIKKKWDNLAATTTKTTTTIATTTVTTIIITITINTNITMCTDNNKRHL